MFWADLAHGEQLVCANSQCFSAGMPVAVWQAQRHREALGIDVEACREGWPRPVLDGRPVPYVTPVTAGHPWWRLTDGGRVLQCQNARVCQVCGLALPSQSWVLVDESAAVLSDSAMHARCLRLAAAACPHLVLCDSALVAVQVRRGDLRADGQPLSERPVPWRESWMVRPGCRGIVLADAATNSYR
jgi:hypothetical protein